MDRPKPLNDVELSGLYELCEEYLDFISNPEEYNEDEDSYYGNYFLGIVMMSLYGEGVFDYVTEKLKENWQKQELG